jgi:hypothetical protein
MLNIIITNKYILINYINYLAPPPYPPVGKKEMSMIAEAKLVDI